MPNRRLFQLKDGAGGSTHPVVDLFTPAREAPDETATTAAAQPDPCDPADPTDSGSSLDITAGDIEAAFDRLTVAVAATSAPPAAGTSSGQDRAAVRATFEELAAVHVAPVRNLVLEIRWGEPPTRLIGLARPALRSLRAMAAELELGDMVRALDAFDRVLAAAVDSGDPTVTGGNKQRLLGGYFPLMRGFPRVFAIDGGRDRREPIIIDALLDGVAGVDQDVLDRLCLVGLGRLAPLLQARTEEMAVVANIPRLAAERIVARVAERVAAAPPGLAPPRPGAAGPRPLRDVAAKPTLEEWLTAELTRDQALLRVRRGEKLDRADLRGADLARAQLAGVALVRADLEGANLGGAQLQKADLRHANLRGANLVGADLTDANLESAELQGARLDRATLTRANLRRANLEAASLLDATLTGARLSFALLNSAKLKGANLQDAVLMHAELQAATLRGVAAVGANFSSANLRGAFLLDGGFNLARFDEANLQDVRAVGARFKAASLAAADLRGADLSGADLRQATLTGAALDGAVLTGAKVAGLAPSGRAASELRADWVDAAQDHGSAHGGDRSGGHIALLVTGVSDQQHHHARYFGPGDVLRNALLEFGPGVRVEIDSLFENCVVRLHPSTELVVGPSAVLADCRIVGGGSITIRGQFFEQTGPSIVGPRLLTVASGGALVATVQQAPGLTKFHIERGARMRLRILNPGKGQTS